MLLENCLDFDLSFEILRASAEVLKPYATEFRYPSDIVEPDISEAEEALTKNNTRSRQALHFSAE